MFVHCAGAMAFWASLLSGRLDGKIASVIASQVTPISKGTKFNTWKSWLGLSEVAQSVGIDVVDPNSRILMQNSYLERIERSLPAWMASLPGSILNRFKSDYLSEVHNICHNGVCHRYC